MSEEEALAQQADDYVKEASKHAHKMTGTANRIYLFTKPSAQDNIMSMLQCKNIVKPLSLLPYDYLAELGTFETKRTNTNASLWMLHNTDSYQQLANLEYQVEKLNREDLQKSGFKNQRTAAIKECLTPKMLEQLGIKEEEEDKK